MKRIFIVSEHVDPSKNSTGYYWYWTIRKTEAQVGRVVVICPSDGAVCLKPVLAPDSVIEVPNSASSRQLWRKAGGQFLFSFRVLMILGKKLAPNDILVSGTNPALLLLLVPAVKMILGFRWLLLVHDVFPDNMLSAGILDRDGYLFGFLSNWAAFSYRCATMIVVIGQDMRDVVGGKLLVKSSLRYVPNWVDVEEIRFKNKDQSSILGRLDWRRRCVFLFFGNLGRVQGVQNLLNAITHVTCSNACFLFVGSGVLEGAVRQFIIENPDKPVAYFESVPLQEKNEILCSCDVALVSLSKGMYGLGVPSKAYFSLAADKPLLIVGDAGSELWRLVVKYNVGWCCSAGDPYSLADLINRVATADLTPYTGRPRDLAVKEFSRDHVLGRFSLCLSELFQHDRVNDVAII